jgi:hypothetical protein
MSKARRAKTKAAAAAAVGEVFGPFGKETASKAYWKRSAVWLTVVSVKSTASANPETGL